MKIETDLFEITTTLREAREGNPEEWTVLFRADWEDD